MRFIDDIIKVIEEHSGITKIHKRVLINRIERWPTEDELKKAKEEVDAQSKS
jgi:hypothetical protein